MSIAPDVMTKEKFLSQITYGETGTTGAEFEMYLYKTRELFEKYKRFIMSCVEGKEAQDYYLNLPDGPVPVSHLLLEKLKLFDADGQWTFEFSGTQIEFRTIVHQSRSRFMDEILTMISFIKNQAAVYGLEVRFEAVGPENISLDIYPFNIRYRQIEERFKDELNVLRAAFRVAGIHFHFGVSNWDEMQAVYNAFVERIEELKTLGDVDGDGERLRIYQIVAQGAGQDLNPPLINSEQEFYQITVEQGFVENLKDCWWYIRITPYGTIEVRVFSTTDDPELIAAIYDRCNEIATTAISNM